MVLGSGVDRGGRSGDPLRDRHPLDRRRARDDHLSRESARECVSVCATERQREALACRVQGPGFDGRRARDATQCERQQVSGARSRPDEGISRRGHAPVGRPSGDVH